MQRPLRQPSRTVQRPPLYRVDEVNEYNTQTEIIFDLCYDGMRGIDVFEPEEIDALPFFTRGALMFTHYISHN